MIEVAVMSGKGGTGKTSVTAGLAALAAPLVVADADVDAADLHLVLGPRILHRHEFRAGHEAVVRSHDCTGCDDCRIRCRFGAISMAGTGEHQVAVVDSLACEGCGLCVDVCPVDAVDFPEKLCGEWYESTTRVGPMVHARLVPGAASSGKLVTLVREAARRRALEEGRPFILVDGPPGVGCPAIAALGGTDLVLAVVEPTRSAAADAERLLSLTAHFGVRVAVTVNKWDLSPATADEVEARVRALGAVILPRLRYDPAVTTAQLRGRTLAELDCPAAHDLRLLWTSMKGLMHRDG